MNYGYFVCYLSGSYSRILCGAGCIRTKDSIKLFYFKSMCVCHFYTQLCKSTFVLYGAPTMLFIFALEETFCAGAVQGMKWWGTYL